jgi:hypothetical protein
MTPDFIEKEVNSRVEKLIVESVDRALRSYSDTGKLIEKAVEDALRVDKLDLPSYGEIVTGMLKVQIDSRVSELVAGKLATDMEELLKLAPKEVKLSEIAEFMLEEHKDGEKWGQVITVMVDPDRRYGSTWVYLDEEEHREWGGRHSCRFSMLVCEDGTISSARVGDKHGLGTRIGRAYGLEQRLRAYVACGTKLILDEDDVITSVGDY